MLYQVPKFCVYQKLSLRSFYTGRDTLSREMPVQQGQETAQHAVYNKIIHTGTSIIRKSMVNVTYFSPISWPLFLKT